MSENVQIIPARLKNASVGGYVAGADDIFDDTLGKDQSVINGEMIEADASLAKDINGIKNAVGQPNGIASLDKEGLVPLSQIPVLTVDKMPFVPDEEDTTNADGKIKLKDKAYAPNDMSGLGRVYLRQNFVDGWPSNLWYYAPVGDVVYLLYSHNTQLYAVYANGVGLGLADNLVVMPAEYNIADINSLAGDRYMTFSESGGVYTITKPDGTTITNTELNNTNIYKIDTKKNKGVNVLTNAMMNKANTIYIIQYDYDLAGNSITVPSGSILMFCGGTFSNGTININGASVLPTLNSLGKGRNLTITGNPSEGTFKYEDDNVFFFSDSGWKPTNEEDAINAIERRVTQIETDMTIINGNIDTIESRISEAEASIAAETQRATGIENGHNERITALETAVGSGTVDERIAAEAAARDAAIQAETDRATTAEENLRTLYNNLQQSQPIPVTALPDTGELGKIYRLIGTTSYADYMWDGTQFLKMAQYDNAIDDAPIAGSENLVKSGGVYNFKDVLVVTKDANPDIELADSIGHVLLKVGGGHIKVKNFDSSDIKKENLSEDLQMELDSPTSVTDTDTADVALSDDNNNIVLMVKNGHVITKNFNSERFTPNDGQFIINDWSSKNICFLGDSIIDEGFVTSAIQDTLKCKIYNRGWSGACVTPTKYLSASDKQFAFTDRCDLEENNTTNANHLGMPSADLIDLVVVHGGTNDYGHGAVTDGRTAIALGTIEEAMDNTVADSDLGIRNSFAAALKYTCYKLKEKYRSCPIALCTIFHAYNYYARPHSEAIVNADMSVSLRPKEFLDGIKTKDDFNDIIRAVARQFGMYVIEFDEFAMSAHTEYYGDLNYTPLSSTGHGDLTHPSQNYGAWNYGRFIARQIMCKIPYMEKSRIG